MKVDAGLAKRMVAELKARRKPAGINSSSKKKKRRQKKHSPNPVQRLFEACEEVFSKGGAGVVPSPEDVERIRSVLDNMKPSDVNLTPKLPYFGNNNAKVGASPVTYLHLYECDKFSICIFCLPASAVIPLHNHPGMTVFSKLLFGSMLIKSYDWADAPQDTNAQSPGLRLAKVKTNSVFAAPCNTSILYPAAGGNMHCFSALTPCAVLDVLGPPYCDPEGRHCAYYNDIPYMSFSGGMNSTSKDNEYAWLEEIESPDDFLVVGAEYTGPQIVNH